MHPWYRGFRVSIALLPSFDSNLTQSQRVLQGTIEKADKDGYKVGGLIERIDESTIEITELPVRTWTQSYKEQLEAWVVGTEKAPALVKVRSFGSVQE